MNELVRLDLDDGGSVLVAVASSDPAIARASRVGDAIRSAATSFESAMGGVRDAAVSALRQVRPAAIVSRGDDVSRVSSRGPLAGRLPGRPTWRE